MNMHVKASKFKVGDRVRVTHTDYPNNIPVGTIASVVRVSDDHGASLAEYEGDNGGLFFFSSEFELAPKFAVGDKVRFTADNPNGGASYGKKGDVITVTAEVSDSGYGGYGQQIAFKRASDGFTYHAPISALEPYTETYTSCAAAEVDNLADEYGGRAGLKIVAGRYYKTRDGRKVGPMVNARGQYASQYPFTVDHHFSSGCGTAWREDGTFDPDNQPHPGDLIAEWPAVAPQQHTTIASIADIVRKHSGTAVVMLIENGQPKPSTRPYVHGDRAAATTEAERLATTMPGSEFGVYELVTRRVADVVVREVA